MGDASDPDAYLANCPRCGTLFMPGVRFCADCGVNLAAIVLGDGPLPAGTVIGNYRICELLGQGGMGRVYVAVHSKLGRKVAIKVLRDELSSNPMTVSRFFDEARAVNRISHPNIVEVTDFIDQPSAYIMELLYGEDLADRLTRESVPPLATTLSICSQMASALAATHAAGIIHRDLKPDNIFLVDRDGREFVKLLDFGVAKLTDPGGQGVRVRSTAAGQIIGTPEYMAPEQADGQQVDYRADIYSLGIVLYLMVAGELPFRGTFGELVIQHMKEPVVLPAKRPEVPAETKRLLDDLLLALLAKQPADRPSSMIEVERRVQDIIVDLDVASAPRGALASNRQTKDNIKPALGRLALQRRETPVPGTVRRDSAIVEKTSGLGHRTESVDRKPEPLTPAPVPVAMTPIVFPTPAGHPEREAPSLAEEPPPATKLPTAPRSSRLPVVIVASVAIAVAAVVAIVVVRGDDDAATTAASNVTAPLPPAAPAEIKLRFSSSPLGAIVRRAGSTDTLGTTPFVKSFPRGTQTMTFQFEKPGFMTIQEEITLDGDHTVAAALPIEPVDTRPVDVATKPTQKPKPSTKKAGSATPIDKSGTMDVFGKP